MKQLDNELLIINTFVTYCQQLIGGIMSNLNLERLG